MYKYYLCDIPSLEEVIDEINKADGEIVTSFWCSDTNQLGIIYEYKEKPLSRIFGKEE